jgi:histidyl-tRNA synthetase
MATLTGFRDFYPADCAFRNAIFSTWRSVAQRYGFVEYDGPPLEELELYAKKSGEELVGQLYHFKDKGDRDVALRPEITPTLAKMVAARHRDYKKPIKWFSIPQVFRYERPQKGRLREHYQFNCDLIGETGLGADIELLALAIDTLRAFGLTSADFIVRLSDRQFWIDFLNTKNVPEEQRYAFFQAIDKSERQPEEKTREQLGTLADEVLSILANGAESPRLNEILSGLRARGLGDYVRVDLRVVRGLAYYTGMVFEIFDPTGQFRAIAGGGRYDGLLKKLGDVDLPALGFGMGDVVLSDVLRAKGFQPPSLARAVYVIVADEAYRHEALGVVQRLRDANFPVEYPLASAKVGKQFEAAEDRGSRFAVVVDAAFAQGQVQVKELATRQQTAVALGELESYLKAQP